MSNDHSKRVENVTAQQHKHTKDVGLLLHMPQLLVLFYATLSSASVLQTGAHQGVPTP